MRVMNVDGSLGMRAENTIDVLKEQLGVERLSIVVLDSLDEYRELLVEVPTHSPPEVPRRLLAIAVAVTAAVFQGVAMILHPCVRVDHLLRIWDFL